MSSTNQHAEHRSFANASATCMDSIITKNYGKYRSDDAVSHCLNATKKSRPLHDKDYVQEVMFVCRIVGAAWKAHYYYLNQ